MTPSCDDGERAAWQTAIVIEHRFEAEVWVAENGSWHFVTLPFDLSDEIDDRAPDAKVGFGSVKVTATIGTTTWTTSVFPDRKARSFILPLKAAVRRSEHVAGGDRVSVALRVGI